MAHLPLPAATRSVAPDVDLFEREGKIVIRADVPGLSREDVDNCRPRRTIGTGADGPNGPRHSYRKNLPPRRSFRVK